MNDDVMKIYRIKNIDQKKLDQIMEIWLQTNMISHSFVSADYWKEHYEGVKAEIPEAEIYAAENEKHQIIGFAGLSGNYIAGLFVAEKWQSQGIGKALTDYIKKNTDSLSLHVFAENAGAVRFYMREGFCIRQEQKNEDTGNMEYRMEWRRTETENLSRKAGIVCCSNGQNAESKETLERLKDYLTSVGLNPLFGKYIYRGKTVFSETDCQRAEELMKFYRDPEIRVIFDVSGGDLANGILPYLDFDLIGGSEKEFWGYSDLTTVINAIYAKTGKSSVLYQVRNLISREGTERREDFESTILRGTQDLYDISYRFLQGECLKGILIGGNIRCLLKLAGTEYWPDMTGKVLLLEAMGGDVPKITTYLNQLNQLHVFDQISGLLLGTFTEMETKNCTPTVEELIMEYVKDKLPVAKTQEIGHAKNAKAAHIGTEICIR